MNGKPLSKSIVEMLKDDPDLANEYLNAAMDEVNEEGGKEALLMALRNIAEVKGMAEVAKRAGMPRENLYRVLSPEKGNPTMFTLIRVLKAMGLSMKIEANHLAHG